MKIYNVNFYIYNIELKVTTNSSCICNGIERFFNIYDKPADLSVKKKIFFNIKDKKDNTLLKQIKNREPVYKTDRVLIYRISKYVFVLDFYSGVSVLYLDVKKSEINGYYTDPDLVGFDFIPNFIIIPALDILFKFKGMFFLHSAGFINRRGTGIILPGSSGSGKSSLSFGIISKKGRLITDDKGLFFREKSKIKYAGILQPVDFFKKKDKFLIEKKFMQKVLAETEDKGEYILLKSYDKDDIAMSMIPRYIIFPEVDNKLKRFQLKKISRKQAVLGLINHSMDPLIPLNYDTHFEMIYRLSKQAETLVLKSNKNFNNILEKLSGL